MTTDVLAMLKVDKSAAEVRRLETRANFPAAAAFADQFRHMGASLKFAEEGGRSIGKPAGGPSLDWFATMPYEKKGRA